MYHISPARNRSSILQEGLRLSDSPSKYVWLFAERDDALQKASKRWGGSDAVDVWEVDVTSIRVIPDPHPGFADVQTFAVECAIPLERVRLFCTLCV